MPEDLDENMDYRLMWEVGLGLLVEALKICSYLCYLICFKDLIIEISSSGVFMF